MTDDNNRMADVDQLLEELQVGIDQATEKLADGRIRDAENEKVRLEYLDQLNKMANTKTNILLNRSDMHEPE